MNSSSRGFFQRVFRDTSVPEWILPAFFLILLCTQLRNQFDNPDGIGYYAHLRSAVLDRDLFYLNEFKRLDMTPYFFDPSPTGYVRSQWPVGSALLWAPFFLVAQGLEGAARGMGFRAARGGYSPFDALAVTFATAFYGFLAVWLCRRMLRERFGDWTSLFAVAAVWLGTSFFNYQFYNATMAHVPSAFAATCFVYVWARDRERRGAAGWALLGALAGLTAMTRTEVGLIALLPVVDAVFGVGGARRERIGGLAVYGAAAGLCFTPQLVVWWTLNGSPFASYQGQVNMLWANPHPLETLFSAFHGLFYWSPAALFAVAGWIAYARRDPRAGAGFAAVFAALLCVNSSLIWWWGSGAFGARFFVGLFPLFAWGIAAFLSRIPRLVSVPLIVAGVVWTNVLLLLVLAGKVWPVRFYTSTELYRDAVGLVTSPWSYFRIFATPKLSGLPLLPAMIGIIAAAAVLFFAAKAFAGRVGRLPMVLCIVVYVLAVNGLLLVCRSHGSGEIARHAPELARAAEHPLEELYEPFPIQYADYYIRTGRPLRALRELRRLERLVPENPAAPVALAGVYLMLGKREPARQAAMRAAGMRIRHPMTRETLRRILRGLGPVRSSVRKL